MDPNKLAAADPALTDSNYLSLQTHYIKSRSIGVLWAVFSISFAIINIIVFVQPQWLGDTELSRGTGYFGLWKSCRLLQDGQDLLCNGKLNDLSTIPTTAFKVSTVFVGVSTLLILACVLGMLLFFFAHPCTVFQLCGWLQLTSAFCLLAGVLIFPAGWDSQAVREVCGSEAGSYNVGQCSVRWAYILAMVGIVDCFVLAILAFTLGTRHTKLMPDQYIAHSMLASHHQHLALPHHQLLAPSGKQNNAASLNTMYSESMSQLAAAAAAAANNNHSASSNPLVYWK